MSTTIRIAVRKFGPFESAIARAPIPDFPDAWSPSLLGLQRFNGGFWGMPYHVDIAPLPAGEGGRSVSLNVFWVLAIAAGSSSPDLVWAFLRHLATAPMDKLTTLEGAIGVRRSTWADREVNDLVPYYHKLDALHARARELPLHPRLSDISHVVDDLLGRAVTSDVPSAVLLDEAQRRVEELVR